MKVSLKSTKYVEIKQDSIHRKKIKGKSKQTKQNKKTHYNLSDHHELKPDTNINGKLTNSWKLKNSLENETDSRQIKKDMKVLLELNKNENKHTQIYKKNERGSKRQINIALSPYIKNCRDVIIITTTLKSVEEKRKSYPKIESIQKNSGMQFKNRNNNREPIQRIHKTKNGTYRKSINWQTIAQIK